MCVVLCVLNALMGCFNYHDSIHPLGILFEIRGRWLYHIMM
jgi:hypothetical protein